MVGSVYYRPLHRLRLVIALEKSVARSLFSKIRHLKSNVVVETQVLTIRCRVQSIFLRGHKQ